MLRYSEMESAAGPRELGLIRSDMERIQALRLFVREVDLGSLCTAALETGIDQPAATGRVTQLERQLGARLLHCSTHGISATEVGQLYADRCRLSLHHVEEAESVACLLQSKLSGVLRTSSPVAFGRRVLAPLMVRFMRANPGLQVDLSFDDRYVNLVEQRPELAARMGMNPWVFVAAPAYLAARPAPTQPDQLTAPDVLIYSAVQGDARWSLSGTVDRTVTVTGRGACARTASRRCWRRRRCTRSIPRRAWLSRAQAAPELP